MRQLVFTVKRYYRPEWGDNWREHFTVDRINGFLGHELKFDNQKLVSNYLRVGYDPDGSWRIYKLRPDFCPAEKVQMEDDITASVVLPRERPERSGSVIRQSERQAGGELRAPAVPAARRCDPSRRGHAGGSGHRRPGKFPVQFRAAHHRAGARALVEHVVEFDQYTEPMKQLLANFVEQPETEFVVSSAHPRMVNGKPSTNPRYLQQRPDLANPRELYLAANRGAAGARHSRGRARFICR